MKKNLLFSLNVKGLFVILILILNLFLYSSELDVLSAELLKNYGEFGFIVTNPQTGKIKVSYNDDMIFYSKYCPGSLLKPFALIALSKTAKIDPYKIINCTGNFSKEISCWLAKGHGNINLINAIANSCNFYFYHLLKDKLDNKAFTDTLKEFSLFYNDEDFNLNKSDFIKSSFGLHEKYTAIPADFIFAYNAFFNGGRIFDRKNIAGKRTKISDELADIISQGMKECYIYGTTKYILEKTGIVDIIAKTGTGSFVDNIKYGVNNNIGWVIVFYPSVNPEFSMLVLVKKGGSSAACKVTAELLKFYNKR